MSEPAVNLFQKNYWKWSDNKLFRTAVATQDLADHCTIEIASNGYWLQFEFPWPSGHPDASKLETALWQAYERGRTEKVRELGL